MQSGGYYFSGNTTCSTTSIKETMKENDLDEAEPYMPAISLRGSGPPDLDSLRKIAWICGS